MISRKTHIIGKPFPLVEAQKKLTGVTCYAGDERISPDMLHARVLFSSHPRARFQLSNLDAARQHPGVVALLTGKDFTSNFGLTVADRKLLAVDQVRYAGQPLAILAAESLQAATEALSLIEVSYEDLPGVWNIETARAASSPKVHPNLSSYRGFEFLNADPEHNIAHHRSFSRGDVDEGFKNADFIVEHSYSAAHLQHASLETHGGVAQMQPDGSLTLWLHIQAPFIQRETIARALHMAPEHVRIISGCVGGSFGGKIYVSIEALLGAIARHTQGRPVRLVLTREEEFKGTFITPALRAHLKMGATKAGRLTAIQARYDWNIGSSIDGFLSNMQAIILSGTGPYAIPNADIQTTAVYTNLLPSAPLKNISIAQIHWAIEQHIDELAEKVGMDPLTFRQWNFIKGGDQPFPDFVMHANGLEQSSRQVKKAIEWQPSNSLDEENPDNSTSKSLRGRGLASGWSPIIFSSQCASRVIIHFNPQELCNVIVDGVDIGQGLYAFVTQIVAFELNFPLEWITVHLTDTQDFPQDWRAIYHDLLWSTGHVLLMATTKLKQQILSYTSEVWKEPVSNLDIVEGEVISYASRRRISLLDLMEKRDDNDENPLTFSVTASYHPDNHDDNQEKPDGKLQSFSSTSYAADVEVDAKTGAWQIRQFAAAADVGHALNPESVKAQIKGGMIQGVSFALLEEMVFDEGVVQTRSFRDYPIATTADTPLLLHPIAIEIPQQSGPYGARDLSNHILVGAAPAIGNAIYQALGVRIRDLPITGQRIYDALQKQKQERANAEEDS